ncbi:hypothetical protein [Hymenobacter edaphi]|uniref:Uncharacterized protein n=1 Tax=Hymenobacter edaphi TaxID=2211146 RepID=A0A328BNJ8_9BACT|nr:hypothetical protein [Hymenobacter edaphi]RAK68265.1 hypothetical protein DLM85_09560 [Hymenobacter edaphi]
MEETPPEQPGDAAVVEVPLGRGRRPGRPPRTTEAPVTWSVRGVSRDARASFERGAARAGKTLGQYLNDDVRRLVEQQLAETNPPATLQAEIQYLRQLVENLTTMIGATPPAAARDEAPPAAE